MWVQKYVLHRYKVHDKIIKVGLNMCDNFVLEKLQCQLFEKELTRTGLVRNTTVDLKINENFVATKWKNQMTARYVTRTEITMDKIIIQPKMQMR